MCPYRCARLWSLCHENVSILVAACAFAAASCQTMSLQASDAGPRFKAGQFNPAHESVELFAAAESGQIKVRFIPRDDTQGRIIIENLTSQPLNVELPQSFAAVPVQAQRMGGGFGFGNGNAGQQSGQNQSVGGGGRQGGRQQGIGQNFFNVPAERVAQVKVQCVCLEHGKDNPRAAIPYRIQPIAEFTADPIVHALCVLLGGGEIDQRAAQAAAWHLANGLGWNQLAAKRIERLDGSSRPYFTPDELRRAKQAVKSAADLAKNFAAPATPRLAASSQ
jgi:hypothetical protein